MNTALYQSIKYEEKQLSYTVIENSADRTAHHKKHHALNNKNNNYERTVKMSIDDRVHPQPNRKFHNDSKKRHILKYDLNSRAILTLFYVGTGSFDVGGFASFFALPGDRSWEISFHRHSSRINDIVVSVAATVM